jgi:putative flippase GtrA
LHFFYLVAQVLSFLAAVAVSYLLNKRWTFRDQRRPLLSRQLIQFLLVSTVGVVLSTVTLALLVRYGQLSDLVAKVIVVLIVLFWNFFANKHWTFRGQS